MADVPTLNSTDPFPNFQFVIQEGINLVAMVTEISGLGFELEQIEHKFVDQNYVTKVQMLPGRKKWEPITLKRALMPSLYFWLWTDSLQYGTYHMGDAGGVPLGARRNMTIILYNRNYLPAAMWYLINAWPSKITGPQIDSSSGDFATEEIVMSHEGIYAVPVGLAGAAIDALT